MAIRFTRMPSILLPEPPSGLRAAVANHHLRQYLLKKLSDSEPDKSYEALPPYTFKSHDEYKDSAGPHQSTYKGKVCIVGAGAAGLYIAMMLKYLGITNVDIIEAAEKVGGRCATYTFTDPTPCTHNYYDMGAMRIPDIDGMKSTLNLIRHEELLNRSDLLVEYVYRVREPTKEDPSVKEPYEPKCYWNSNDRSPNGSVFDTVIKTILTDFQADYLKYLSDGNDDLSTRSWLMQKAQLREETSPGIWITRPLTYEETMAAELSDTSTGLFDQALTETLYDYIDFAQATGKDWYRIKGGMSQLTNSMEKLVRSTSWPQPEVSSPPVNISLSTPVVSMSKSAEGIDVITTDAAGNVQPKKTYDMVFSTTAMGPLQRMDIAGLELPDEVLTGIRALSYDRATKVAIKFKTRWWKDFYRNDDVWGGVSQSDLPISNVVYPSWDDGADQPNVLMVSYSWAQDATRMASLVPDYSKTAPQKSDPIVALCLRDLEKLWASQPNAPSFDFLWDNYAAHHAWAWSHDQWTGGAFALFGPGQFGHIYPRFLVPFCDNKFALCGEALSAHHAWVSGALDSAYGAVLRWLHEMKDRKKEVAHLIASPFGGGKDEHPEEFDDKTLHWAARLSGPKYE